MTDMKQGWVIKRLDEVCTFINGRAYNKVELLQEGKYRVLRVGNFFTNNNWYYSDLELPENKYCENGDLLYAWSASFGPKIWSGEKVIYHYHIWKIIQKNELITKDFLFRFLDWDTEQIKLDQGTGSTMMHVTKGSIEARLIQLPPISEQQRIVSILDTAFEAIDKAKANVEQNLKNSKELFESYLQNIFSAKGSALSLSKGEGWINSTIGETCNLQTGGTPSTTKKEYYENGTIKWLVSGDINQKVINDCEGRITELGMNNSNTKYLPVNSVLIALNGQGKTRGTVAMLKTKATCNQSLVSIFPKDENLLLPELVFSNLEGRYDEIRKMTGDSGNDRRGLNMPLIRSIKFSYPKNINEQKEIVIKLDALRFETKKLESIYQQKLIDLEELKKSLLEKAFKGELKTEKIEVV